MWRDRFSANVDRCTHPILAQWLLDHSDDIPEHDGFDDLDPETAERRLRDASRRRRRNEAQFDTSDGWNDGHSDWEDESDWF